MDSFCSLFDPSDGQNKPNKKRHKADDTVKKKCDIPPKGRRRGRRASGKNETLPEESSFLCEPQLSTELLVKDVSYLENYIEINKRDDETRCDDKKPKRRNSGRRNRRRKKCSPPKDIQGPTEDGVEKECDVNWNNQSEIQKISKDSVGKNVNDLRLNEHSDYKSVKRKDFRELDNNVYQIIEKLEKVNLKDDTYLAGDFDTEVLDDDFIYSSDDMDDLDLITDAEDSSSEVYGSLPPEPRFGNVEYKLQLVSPCERRFQHLVTQLKWRLRSGGGAAVYVVGVRDCGALVGLPPKALRGSLRTLRRMAAALGAHLAHVTARRVCKHRAVAEVYLRMIADSNQSVELRVAVMGANEAGKSTLIGVLTQGELDNGRGSARLNMFRHLHEVKSGRTSSLSHEILGFDAQGNVVNYGCSELMTAERIGERSAKLVSFLDLAGHTKYQRTTLHGLTGYSPHYAMLVISATAGITRITEEHIGLLVALKLSFFTVITKCELAAGALPGLIARLEELLAPADKKPLLISDENAARNCVAPQKLILDSLDRGNHGQDPDEVKSSKTEVAVFPVSCVRGMGLNTLHAYLLALQPPTDQIEDNDANEPCEFQIDEIFHVDETAGPVVGGLLARGRVCEGDRLLVGPLDAGEFVDVTVRSVYRNRVQCGVARAGRSASLGLDRTPLGLRAGMVLLTAPPPGREGPRPTFGGCGGACAERVSKLIQSGSVDANCRKNRRNARRRNKNLLQDIANVENSLTKECILENNNTYKSDSDAEHDKDTSSDSEGCICKDEIPLEDPNDPRGCIFFQASVHVLRHATTIYPGFQCTVHVGNVRQTAIIEGIMSHNNSLSAGGRASVVFRFTRCPEYLVVGRTLLFTAGLGTRAIGQITQIFPYLP